MTGTTCSVGISAFGATALALLAGCAGPTEMAAANTRGDKAAGTAPPGGRAVWVSDSIHRQPIGHHNE